MHLFQIIFKAYAFEFFVLQTNNNTKQAFFILAIFVLWTFYEFSLVEKINFNVMQHPNFLTNYFYLLV